MYMLAGPVFNVYQAFPYLRLKVRLNTAQSTLCPLSPPPSLGSYDEVEVTNFTTSWRDGLAFCAILNRHRPDLLSYDDCLSQQPLENIETAFKVAEEELGIIKIVDPEGESTHTPTTALFGSKSRCNTLQY